MSSEMIDWMSPAAWWWTAACAAAGFLLAFLLDWWGSRRRSGVGTPPRCHQCGYDLRAATAARCPECGNATRPPRTRHGPRRRWWVVAPAVTLIVAVPGYRAVLWSKARGWSPPLPEWKVVERVALGGGFVAECVVSRRGSMFDAVRVRRGFRTLTQLGGFGAGIMRVRPAESGIAPGDDMTGNGLGNVVLTTYSGGAHCCTTIHVLELSPGGNVQQIAEIDAHHGAVLRDVDSDGLPEIVMPDWYWAYQLSCFTCVRCPLTVLKFRDGGYGLAIDLMRRDAPDEAEWARLLERVRAGVGQRGNADHLWSGMLELIYTGHPDLAWRLADEIWRDVPGATDAELDGFRAILERASHWPALRDAAAAAE